jgi:hypothetical protein
MYRLSHALRFELETTDSTLRESIVNLDRPGNGALLPDSPT